MNEFRVYKKSTDPVWINPHGGIIHSNADNICRDRTCLSASFLPGDSLLFITGMIIANSLSPFSSNIMNLIYWMSLIIGCRYYW